MSDIKAIYVKEIFPFNYDTNRYPKQTDITNLQYGDTYIVIFGFDQHNHHKNLIKDTRIKILYDSGPRWNNAHGMVDRTKWLICVVFELVSDGKNRRV